MNNERLEKIEEILEEISSATSENSTRIDETLLSLVETQTTLKRLQIKLNENHPELKLKADIRRLETKINHSSDQIGSTLGRKIDDINRRLAKLEDKSKF
jgi:hypothetical protein